MRGLEDTEVGVNKDFAGDVNRKAVLITGAGRRIGRALAEDLGAAGWKVAVHYHGSAAEADEVVAAITAKGGQAVKVQADLGDADSVAKLVPAAVKAVGPLGCLINNASIFERDEIETATLDSWERHIAINLRAPFFLSQAFAAQMAQETNGNGVIINIIDERVWHLTPHFASYTVSKAGLWTLTQTLAMALAPRIRVNAIGPGPTLPSPYQSQAQFDQQCARMPGGQHMGWGQVADGGTPE